MSVFQWFKVAGSTIWMRLNHKTGELETEDEIMSGYTEGYSVGALFAVAALVAGISIISTWGWIELRRPPALASGIHMLSHAGHHREAVWLSQLEHTCGVPALGPTCAQMVLDNLRPELAQAVQFGK